MSIDKKAFGLSDSLISAVSEALKGGQVKLDKNHNGKLDGQDFKMLRKEENIDEKSVSKAQQHAAGAALATQRGEYDGGKKGGAINRMASMKTSELRKFAGTKTKGLPTHKEEVEQVDEISLKTKIKAYAATREPDADYNRGDKVHSQGDRIRSKIVAKHGEKAGDHADRAAYGKPSTPATRSAEKSKSDPLTKATSSTNKMRITKSGVANKQDQKSNAAVIKSRIGKHGKSNLPEDIEQVDELSKATLGSYIKKAATDVATNSAATGRHAERSNKIADHQKKTGDYSHENQRRKDSKTADKAFDKSWKRRQGINKATDKLTKEDVQVDELSTDTYHSAAKKAAKRAMGDAQGRSGPIFKKYAGMANKFRDKGMSQEKKEKAVKEETLDEIQGTYGNGGNKKNLKIIHKGVVVKDYGTDTKPNKASRDKKAEKMKAYRADRDKNMEEEIQIDEISKKLAARYNNKVGPIINKNQNSGGDPAKLLKRKNREAGHKLSWNKYHNYKVKVAATEETDPGFTEAAENPMAKQLADKKAAIQKIIAQKKIQAMQSKANKQISAMKEGKGCSCMEGKKSMTCEVHGDNSKDKLGKEKIELNPPLRD